MFIEIKHQLLQQCADYIIDNDKEHDDYIDWCIDNNLNSKEKNHTAHIYGVAREALGLPSLEKI